MNLKELLLMILHHHAELHVPENKSYVIDYYSTLSFSPVPSPERRIQFDFANTTFIESFLPLIPDRCFPHINIERVERRESFKNETCSVVKLFFRTYPDEEEFMIEWVDERRH